MEVSAGIILYHRTPLGSIIALIQEKNRGGRYDIPGGRRKETQTIEECAIDETEEETRGLIRCVPGRLQRVCTIGEHKQFVVFAYELSIREIVSLNKYAETEVPIDHPEWHETSDLKWVRFNSLLTKRKMLQTIDQVEIEKTHRLLQISKKIYLLRKNRKLPWFISQSLKISFASFPRQQAFSGSPSTYSLIP